MERSARGRRIGVGGVGALGARGWASPKMAGWGALGAAGSVFPAGALVGAAPAPRCAGGCQRAPAGVGRLGGGTMADATEALDHIGQLTPDPANRRKHTPRNVGLIVDALQKVGAARSIVVDEQNVVLAGNGVVDAAAEAGITKLRVIDVDGDTLVAVRRRNLTDEQKRALAIFDNRSAELAEWNVEQLQADAASGLDLEPYFTPDELTALGVAVPTFAGDDGREQPRLDQRKPTTCPACGHEFIPE